MSESITGAGQLESLGARLVAEAETMRVELQAALHGVAEATLVKAARANARDRLPKKGGLNEVIANSEFVVQDRPSSIAAWVRVGTTASDTRALNRGRIRHPVFGHRDRFVEQKFEPGVDWFDDAMRGGEAEVSAVVAGVLEAAARVVTEG